MIREEQFDELFNDLISLVIERGDQGNRQIINAISSVYEIREFIPEILLFEKQIKERLFVFKYADEVVRSKGHMGEFTVDIIHPDEERKLSLDLEFTIRSMISFFMVYSTTDKQKLIDDVFVVDILVSLKKLMMYITSK